MATASGTGARAHAGQPAREHLHALPPRRRRRSSRASSSSGSMSWSARTWRARNGRSARSRVLAPAAQLVVLRYSGSKGKKPLALVGKGITFDTGGFAQARRRDGRDEVRHVGAAAVLGTLRALAEMRAPVNVIGIIPACENMPGGYATKPGDVVTISGKPSRSLNTDAEGRLILCDALSYAERFEPDTVIATLTGACVIALGHVATGPSPTTQSLPMRAAADDAWDRVGRCRRGRTTRSSCARTAPTWRTSAGGPRRSPRPAFSRASRKAALGAPRHRRHRVEERPRERLDRPADAASSASP